MLWMWLASFGPEPADHRQLDQAISFAVAGDETCVEPERVLTQVRGWLGRDTIEARLEFEVFATTEALGFTARRDGAAYAQRSFDRVAVHCADANAVLALALAVAIDASLLGDLGVEPAPPPPPSPAPAPEPAVVPAPEPHPKPAAVAVPERAKPSSVGWWMLLGGRASLGLLPTTSFGGAIEVGAIPISWLQVGVRGWAVAGLPMRQAEGRVDVLMGAAGPRVCPVVGNERVRGRLCAGVDFGAVRARGSGYLQSRVARFFWAGAAIGTDVQMVLGRKAFLGLGVDATAPFQRPRFEVVDTRGAVLDERTPPPVAAGFTLGVGVLLR